MRDIREDRLAKHGGREDHITARRWRTTVVDTKEDAKSDQRGFDRLEDRGTTNRRKDVLEDRRTAHHHGG
jgi:hypothetical protein